MEHDGGSLPLALKHSITAITNEQRKLQMLECEFGKLLTSKKLNYLA
jgi:hypothetical protein